jgi:hypothetical protein
MIAGLLLHQEVLVAGSYHSLRMSTEQLAIDGGHSENDSVNRGVGKALWRARDREVRISAAR